MPENVVSVLWMKGWSLPERYRDFQVGVLATNLAWGGPRHEYIVCAHVAVLSHSFIDLS